MPIFSSTPASVTEPTVGDSVCASGSHVCSGQSGLFTANASPSSTNAVSSTPRDRFDPADSATMSPVPAFTTISTTPTRSRTEPASVYSTNFIDACRRSGPPQPAMIAYIGSSTTSNSTKNSTRSSAMNTPTMPNSTASSSATSSWARATSSTRASV